MKEAIAIVLPISILLLNAFLFLFIFFPSIVMLPLATIVYKIKGFTVKKVSSEEMLNTIHQVYVVASFVERLTTEGRNDCIVNRIYDPLLGKHIDALWNYKYNYIILAVDKERILQIPINAKDLENKTRFLKKELKKSLISQEA